LFPWKKATILDFPARKGVRNPVQGGFLHPAAVPAAQTRQVGDDRVLAGGAFNRRLEGALLVGFAGE